jgi:hypothetical protein
MLLTAIGIFSLAAILGMILLSFILRNKAVTRTMVYSHGTVAILGIMLLLVYALFRQPTPLASIILFCLAALGGFTMAYRDLTGKTLPKWMAIGHGITAILGFVFLLVFAFFR